MTNNQSNEPENREQAFDTGKQDYSYSIAKASLGDKFMESAYGRTLYGEVITEPKSEGEYLSFNAKMSDGRVVTYGGSLENSAYWPDIVKIEHWPEQRQTINPQKEVK